MVTDRKMQLSELDDRVGVSVVTLSYLKIGKVKAIRFSILNVIWRELNSQLEDILEYTSVENDQE